MKSFVNERNTLFTNFLFSSPPLFQETGSDSHYSRVYASRVKKGGESRGTPPRLELHPSKDVDTCRDLQSRNYGYTIGNDTGWTRGQSHYPPWSPTKPRDIRSAANSSIDRNESSPREWLQRVSRRRESRENLTNSTLPIICYLLKRNCKFVLWFITKLLGLENTSWWNLQTKRLNITFSFFFRII